MWKRFEYKIKISGKALLKEGFIKMDASVIESN